MKAIILLLKTNTTKIKFRSRNIFLAHHIQILSRINEEYTLLIVCSIVQNTHKIQPFGEILKRKHIKRNQQLLIHNYILG